MTTAKGYRLFQERGVPIDAIRSCKKCGLAETRTQVVLSRGHPCATIHLIGEAPGADEDAQGLAFVGRAGRLLDTCIWKAGLPQFFIHNILKCRPPENRDPMLEEVKQCTHWLQLMLTAFAPRVIVAMGRYSIGYFRGYPWAQIKSMSVTKEHRGRTFRWLVENGPVVVPTFHPAYLLRNPEVVPGFVNRLRLAQRYAIALTSQR